MTAHWQACGIGAGRRIAGRNAASGAAGDREYLRVSRFMLFFGLGHSRPPIPLSQEGNAGGWISLRVGCHGRTSPVKPTMRPGANPSSRIMSSESVNDFQHPTVSWNGSPSILRGQDEQAGAMRRHAGGQPPFATPGVSSRPRVAYPYHAGEI